MPDTFCLNCGVCWYDLIQPLRKHECRWTLLCQSLSCGGRIRHYVTKCPLLACWQSAWAETPIQVCPHKGWQASSCFRTSRARMCGISVVNLEFQAFITWHHWVTPVSSHAALTSLSYVKWQILTAMNQAAKMCSSWPKDSWNCWNSREGDFSMTVKEV